MTTKITITNDGPEVATVLIMKADNTIAEGRGHIIEVGKSLELTLWNECRPLIYAGLVATHFYTVPPATD